MLLADKRDYRQGYKKHYSAYSKLSGDQGSVHSRRLLLAYCVECGLKYLLLEKWHENNLIKIIKNNDCKKKDIISSHNLDKMLKELGQMGTFKFIQVATNHQDIVTSENYHQVCRYCIKIKDNDKVKEEGYEIELKKIVRWIEERV